MKHRLLNALFLCLCSLSAAAQAKEERDVVLLRDGKSQSIAIEAENWDTLAGKGSPPIPWDKVASVSYVDAPEFTKGVEAFDSGNFTLALQQFELVKDDPKLRKVFKQQIAFDSAYILAQEGKHDQAIAAYQDVLKTYAKGRYHVRAVDGLAGCLIAKNDVAGALKAVDAALADANAEAGLAAAIGLVKARLLTSQKKFAEAKPLFVAASSAQGAPQSVVLEGQLGQAFCLLQEGDAGGAESSFRTLTKAEAPKHVLAGAWNGLGDVLSKQGRDKKDIDQLLDALFCYLRGSTVYAPIAGDPTNEYERSLAGSVRCFNFVADLEPNKERKRLFQSRANERKELLKKEFPNSPFLESL